MSDVPKKQSSIGAGKAYMAAIESDPASKQALATALKRLQSFALSVKLANRLETKGLKPAFELATFTKELNKVLQEQLQGLVGECSEEARAEQLRLTSELRREAEAELQMLNNELMQYGFEPLENDLESWEELARITEKEPGPMTMEEIYRWAIAWAKRELIRAKIARGETSPQITTNPKQLHPAVRSSEEASILRDDNDPCIAWCIGKRIYLGNDTQVSRLFWLLASPVGRACSLAEVQRAVDIQESSLDVGTEEAEIRKSHQRVRKAISKLRATLVEGKAEDHVLITRGGTQVHPEYTMLLRFS
ncbi:MAG: hypothetical protein NTW52_18665 [Planctomycetota bacterium]|nr:hypothetical protein [Planctomycetota bacterium]